MYNYRLLFEKTGIGIYCSHLDLMRTMQRAFNRAGVKLRHTEGFNPHPHMIFALPLSVGVGSRCELVDFTTNEPIDMASSLEFLSQTMPSGIHCLELYEPDRKFKEIKWIEFSGQLIYDFDVPIDFADKLNSLFSRETLKIMRKTKRGESLFDLSPNVCNFKAESVGKIINIRVLCSAMEPTVNSEHIFAAVALAGSDFKPDYARFERLQLFDSNFIQFK